jgi:hypothetical protein
VYDGYKALRIPRFEPESLPSKFLKETQLKMTLLEKISSIEFSKMTIAWSLFASWIVYIISIAIHRLYFSQYAKFPGPKLAALTYGYVFYYDVIAGSGEYMYKIEKLHKEYSTC